MKIEDNNNENNFNQNCSIIIKNSTIIENHNFKEKNDIIIHYYSIIEIKDIFIKNNNNNIFNEFITILNKNQTCEIKKIKKDHNKYSSDKMIKKIKVILINNLLQFVNSELIGSKVSKKYKVSLLKKLDYKFTSNIKIDDTIKCLNMTVKELLSFEITKKYTRYNKNSNKIIIDKILEKVEKDKKRKKGEKGKNEKNGKNDEIIKYIEYVFNLKFKEWIDIFTMKKEGNSNVKIDGLHKVLNKILHNSKESYIDEVYFVQFVHHLYNFEKWFLDKKEREKGSHLKRNSKSIC